MTSEKKQNLKVHRAEAERRIQEARKELARFKAERQDARDRDDLKEITILNKLVFEANKKILMNRKAIEEIDAKLNAA